MKKLQQPGVLLTLGAAALFIVFFVGGAIIAQKIAGPKVEVPATAREQVKFPVYLPQKLPGTYKIQDSSFTVREDTLIFAIKDAGGNSMAVTEQRKNDGMNFTQFYEQQFKGAQKLNGTPFASTYGKSNDEKMHLLSIETPETWILVTANTTNEQEMTTIAKSLQKQ